MKQSSAKTQCGFLACSCIAKDSEILWPNSNLALPWHAFFQECVVFCYVSMQIWNFHQIWWTKAEVKYVAMRVFVWALFAIWRFGRDVMAICHKVSFVFCDLKPAMRAAMASPRFAMRCEQMLRSVYVCCRFGLTGQVEAVSEFNRSDKLPNYGVKSWRCRRNGPN